MFAIAVVLRIEPPELGPFHFENGILAHDHRSVAKILVPAGKN